MSCAFSGVRWISLSELGLSQLYLSETKLQEIDVWLSAEALSAQPLPVYDFGNGRLTLIDGHCRAFAAWRSGMSAVPVAYCDDDYLSSELGQLLYRDEVLWCERMGLRSVADLASRILPEEEYERRIVSRCERSYDLWAETPPDMQPVYAALRPELHLYGISDDLKTLYFEDEQGVETQVSVNEAV